MKEMSPMTGLLQGLVSKGPGTGLRDISASQRAQTEVIDRPGSELI